MRHIYHRRNFLQRRYRRTYLRCSTKLFDSTLTKLQSRTVERSALYSWCNWPGRTPPRSIPVADKLASFNLNWLRVCLTQDDFSPFSGSFQFTQRAAPKPILFVVISTNCGSERPRQVKTFKQHPQRRSFNLTPRHEHTSIFGALGTSTIVIGEIFGHNRLRS